MRIDGDEQNVKNNDQPLDIIYKNEPNGDMEIIADNDVCQIEGPLGSTAGDVTEDNPQGQCRTSILPKWIEQGGYDFSKWFNGYIIISATVYINSMKSLNNINRATQNAIEHIVLTQMGMKLGIKVFVGKQ